MSLARFYNTDYKEEDIDFYQEQERKLHCIVKLIKQNGYNPDLYIPVGGWKYNDDERKKLPFPNQLLTAYRWFYAAYCLNIPIIYTNADFQGGKTGVQQCFLRLVLTNADKLESRYSTFAITGMSDTSLKNQMLERFPSEFEKQIFHLDDFKLDNNKMVTEINNIVSQYGYCKNITILDDESRVASNKDNLKNKIFEKIKETSLFETWSERGIRYIAIDATDPATAINANKLKNSGQGVNITLELPPSYLSLKKLKDLNRLHLSKDLKIKNNVIDFKNQLHNLYDQEKLWHIIRMPNGKYYKPVENNIKEVFGNNIGIVTWNSTIKQNSTNNQTDINKCLLFQQPQQPTLVLIKNSFYAGKTLDDTYIGALYDRKSKKDDTNGQSLPGRACGHNRSLRTHVWCDLDSIDRIIDYWKSIINQDVELVNSPMRISTTLNGRMNNIETTRVPGMNGIQIQTTGNEITRPENLQNNEVINLPNRLKPEHMGQTIGPCNNMTETVSRLNTEYGNSRFNPTARNIDGFYINSRLIGWYKSQYTSINDANDLKKEHILTQNEFDTIALSFGCSSRTGQPYMLYPVYPNKNSQPNEVKWYIRYIQKRFTRFNTNN